MSSVIGDVTVTVGEAPPEKRYATMGEPIRARNSDGAIEQMSPAERLRVLRSGRADYRAGYESGRKWATERALFWQLEAVSTLLKKPWPPGHPDCTPENHITELIRALGTIEVSRDDQKWSDQWYEVSEYVMHDSSCLIELASNDLVRGVVEGIASVYAEVVAPDIEW